MKDMFNYIIANFKNDASFRVYVLAIVISLLIPIIYITHRKRRGKSLHGLSYMITACIVVLFTSFMFIRSPIRHAGEYWDTVLCEYIVSPPIRAYFEPDEKTLAAANSVREWYMTQDKMSYNEAQDKIKEKLIENGFIDEEKDDYWFIFNVSDYLYWQKWLNDMDEYLDRRYAEKGVIRTEKLQKKEGISSE